MKRFPNYLHVVYMKQITVDIIADDAVDSKEVEGNVYMLKKK